MAKQDFDPEAMERAAEVALLELVQIPKEALLPVAKWMEKHYMKAGYKRLGRLLVQIAGEAKGEED